jgi:hypothetical protein
MKTYFIQQGKNTPNLCPVGPYIEGQEHNDITVSYDDAWQKGGDTQRCGVGSVVDVFTGYVVTLK